MCFGRIEWIPVKYAPWDGANYLLTDGRSRWISRRRRGKMHKDGAPISGRDFSTPNGTSYPTHYAHIPPLPTEDRP
jgi:hypothetical protein